MLRCDIKNICSELAKKQSLNFMLVECYNLIFKYCKENQTVPRKNKYEIKNGRLFINDKYVGIVEIIQKTNFSEYGYYIEGKILARQENI